MPFVMTQALSGRLPLADAVKLVTSQAARLFGLYPRKGTLQPGADADITLYDPRTSGTIDSERWLSQSRVTERLYHGKPRHGHVVTTIVNGTIVFDGDRIVGKPGTGRFVRPHLEA